jgi:predicted phosphoribosyltransferase
MQLFRDRFDAGLALAERLRWTVAADPATLVIGLARGGVAVGGALAECLKTQLDVLVVQELELPDRPGLSVGSMVSGGMTVLNDAAIQYLRVSEDLLDRLSLQAARELSRKEKLYRDGRPPLPVKGRTVILADDGCASSTAILAAAHALRPQGVKKLVVSVPMASQQAVREFGPQADDIVCIALPLSVGSPAMWYQTYSPVADEDIRKTLESAAYETKAAAAGTY